MAGSHYIAQTGYVVFAPGESTQEVRITLIDDLRFGPRQRTFNLGLTPLADSEAQRLSQRSMEFLVPEGSQLRSLTTGPVDPSLALDIEGSLPFQSQEFRVVAPSGSVTLRQSISGVVDLNSYSAFNEATGRYEPFLFDGQTGVQLLDASLDGLIDTFQLHLVDGGRGDLDGVVNGVVSIRSLVGQTTPGPLQVTPGIFYIPSSSDGQLQFHNLTARGDYQMGVLPVDDAQGRIGGLLPGDPGYRQAALARLQQVFQNAPTSSPRALTPAVALEAFADPSVLVQSEFQATGSFQEAQLLPNQHYSLYWLQGEDLQLSSDNPGFSTQSDGRGYTRFQWSNTAFEVATPTLLTPGQSGQTVAARFDLARGGSALNQVSLFRVDSLTGGLDSNGDGQIDARPGDASYLPLALARIQDPLTGVVLPRVDTIFQSTSFAGTLAAGQMYGIALITNGTVEDLQRQNPANLPGSSIHGFFSFEAANPDGLSHVRRLGQNLWGFEDLLGGGDRDFNDMLLKVEVTAGSV